MPRASSALRANGHDTLRDDGARKVLRGHTAVQEVLKAKHQVD